MDPAANADWNMVVGVWGPVWCVRVGNGQQRSCIGGKC